MTPLQRGRPSHHPSIVYSYARKFMGVLFCSGLPSGEKRAAKGSSPLPGRARLSRRTRPTNDWKSQQVPDPEDAPVPQGKWCKVPLLVFAAGRGRIRQQDPEAVALEKRLPGENARLVVVTKSGHGIHEEQTELFNREVLAFLKEVGR